MDAEIRNRLLSGCVIPAHPLALNDDLILDEKHQQALTRYYLAAGAGGLAVGVHTTQFRIHEPQIGLYQPVLELAVHAASEYAEQHNLKQPILIAGIVGSTEQAVREATLARNLGYHMGLISLQAMKGSSIDSMIAHTREVARVIPIMGFYLQETISGMVLPEDFWQQLVEIPELCAVKVAPFDRYHTLDVLSAVAQSGRHEEIALYTGNDDHILFDLMGSYEFHLGSKTIELRFAGGLLGQWACWTRKAVEYHTQIMHYRKTSSSIPQQLLSLARKLTWANKAIFDTDNCFKGCIPGIAYVLKKQGLLKNLHSLDPEEVLSQNQARNINRIIEDYPELTDNTFVQQNLHLWLRQ